MAVERFIPITLKFNAGNTDARLRDVRGRFVGIRDAANQFGQGASNSFSLIDRESQRTGRSLRNNIGGAFSSLRSQASGLSSAVSSALSFTGGGALLNGLSAVTGGLAGIASEIFNVNDQLERAEVGFKTLLGSSSAAKSLIAELRQFSKTTPFELSGTVRSAQSLLAQGVERKDLLPLLRGVGSGVAASGGTSADFDGVITQLAQTVGKGKAELEDLKIIAERGIPVFKILGQAIGVTDQNLFKLLSDGRLRGKETVQLLAEEFGRKFPNALDDLSKTTSGAVTNIKESLTGAAVDVAKPGFESLNKVLQKTNSLLNGAEFDNFKKKAEDASKSLVGAAENAISTLFSGSGQDNLSAATSVFKENQSALDKLKQGNLKGALIGEGFSLTKDGLADRGVTKVKELFNSFGAAIPAGAAEGTQQGTGNFTDSIKSMAERGWNAFTGFWEIKSPSKRARRGGEFVGDGFTEGLIDRTSVGFKKWAEQIEKNGGEAFILAVEKLAKKVGANPNDVLNVLAFESRLNPKTTNSIGATGLIQFLPSTAKGLGTTTSALRSQSAVEQLAYVEKYLLAFGKTLDTTEKLYSSILRGRVLSDPDSVLFTKGTKAYAQNPLDFDKDGTVTLREATTPVRKQGFGNSTATAAKPFRQQAAPRVNESVSINSTPDLLSLSDIVLPPELNVLRVPPAIAQRTAETLAATVQNTMQSAATATADLTNQQLTNFKRIVVEADTTAKETEKAFSQLAEGVKATLSSAFDSLLNGDVKGAGNAFKNFGKRILSDGLTNLLTRGNQGGGAKGLLNTFLGGGGEGGGLSNLFRTPGFNPAASTPGVSAGGGFLGKIGGFLGIGAGAGAALAPAAASAATGVGTAAGAANAAAIASIFGGGAAAGGTAAAAGGAAAGGAAGIGSLLGGLAPLLTNPITAIVAGAAIGGFFLFKKFSNRDLKSLRKLINQRYGVDVKDNSVLKQIRDIGKQAFGKQYNQRLADVVALPEVKDLVTEYAESNGLESKLPNKRELSDPYSASNYFTESGSAFYQPSNYGGGSGTGASGVASGGGTNGVLTELVEVLRGFKTMPFGAVVREGLPLNNDLIAEGVNREQRRNQSFGNQFLTNNGF